MPDTRRGLALAAALFSVVVWGASFIATKVALRELTPAALVWLRFAIGVVMLGAALAVRGGFQRLSMRDLGLLAVLGLQGITFHQWLQSTGLQTAQATTTAWIVCTSPVFIALLSWLWLRERIGALGWSGIALAGLGVLVVVTRGDLTHLAQGGVIVRGDWLVLASAPNWAIFSVASRRVVRDHPVDLAMFYVMLFGWLGATPLMLASGGVEGLTRLSREPLIAVLFLGVCCSGLAYLFWYRALQVLPAAHVGALLYLEPFVAVLVAAVMLGERATPALMLGGAVILLGLWMVGRSRG